MEERNDLPAVLFKKPGRRRQYRIPAVAGGAM